MAKKPPLYPHVPKSQRKAEQESASKLAGTMEVRLWTGTRIPVSDREEAVRVINRELEGWKEEGDRIVWYKKQEADLLPSIAYVMDSVGELTDASAIIVSKREEMGFLTKESSEVKAKHYYCDNTRLHSNNEVLQIKTEEEDPKCPYCGAVMTYGRYWGPLVATQL